jgi:hypothetical protein
MRNLAILLTVAGVLPGCSTVPHYPAVPPDASAPSRPQELLLRHLSPYATKQEQTAAIRSVTGRSDAVDPTVLFEVSARLFERGEKDLAAFWFYAAQLRTRFDVNRCRDKTAAGVASSLTRAYGPRINEYTFANVPTLKKLVPMVIEWDRGTPHNYPPGWACVGGINFIIRELDRATGSSPYPGTQSDLQGLVPSSEWPAIKERTREDYMRGFADAMASLPTATR